MQAACRLPDFRGLGAIGSAPLSKMLRILSMILGLACYRFSPIQILYFTEIDNE
jgi:hypothetical protein